MIIIEFIAKSIKIMCWCIARFIVWIVTARDCRHCKYGELTYCYADDYYKCKKAESETNSMYDYTQNVMDCKNSILRKNFERKN